MQNESQKKRVTRRSFGAAVGAGLAAVPGFAQQTAQQTPEAAQGQQPARPAGPGNWRRPLAPDTPAFDGPLSFTRADMTLKAVPFPMTQVRLLPGSIYY